MNPTPAQLAALYPELPGVIARLHRQRTLACLKREYERAADACAGSQWRLWAVQEATVYARARIERRARVRPNRAARKAAKARALAIYDCDRQFGGPEEGGWWYDTGRLISREGRFWNEDRAYAECRRLNDWCHAINEAEGRAPISSVICTGVLEARLMDADAPAYFPTVRPHYE